jgi:hypothetical protein
MSSSSSRDDTAEGVGESADNARRTFPPLLMNSRSNLVVNAGPRPICPSRQCSSSSFGAMRRPFDLGGSSII